MTDLAGVAATAFGVARIRAAESKRPDALFVDPLAVEIAGRVGSVFAGANRSQEPLAIGLRNQVVLRTACYDRWLLDAIDDGVRQVVIVAAGYDARAWRLGLPPDTVVWELDQPDVLDKKARLVAAAGMGPAANRRAVPVDLRNDFSSALAAAGHDPTSRTAWLIEGLIVYLDRPDAVRLLTIVAQLSPAGSRLATEAGRDVDALTNDPPKSERLQRLRALWLGGLGEPTAGWLQANGWSATTISPREMAITVGRPQPPVETGTGFVTAIRTG